MKKISLSLLILFLFTLNGFAQNIRGINIESPCERIVVFINKERVSNPVESCMISNLLAGNYLVEAFAIDARGRYNRLVYKDRLYFNGNGVINIELEDSFIGFTHQYPHPMTNNPNYDIQKLDREPMNARDFNKLISAIRKETFDKDKFALMELVSDETYLSIEQLIRIMNIFTFDNEKLIVFKSFYPNVLDKENSYTLLEQITFDRNKNKIKDFIIEHKNKGK